MADAATADPAPSKQGSKQSLKEELDALAATAAAGSLAASGADSGEVPQSPVDPAPVSRQGSQLQPTASRASMSGSAVQRQGSQLSRQISRQGSQISRTSPLSPVAVEEPAEEPKTPEQLLTERDAQIADLEREVYRKSQQVDSLTRLMESGSQDTKIKLMQDDLSDKSARIKKLEAEAKKEKKRADDAEKALAEAEMSLKEARRNSKSVPAPVTKQPSADDSKLQGQVQEKDRQISALEEQLRQRSTQAQKAEERAAAAERRAAVPQIPQEAKQFIIQLQQNLALKEAELQQTTRKLDEAREAIVESAGCGFDNDVRLHQAQSALRNIIKKAEASQAGSPQRRWVSTSPGLSTSPQMHADPARSPSASPNQAHSASPSPAIGGTLSPPAKTTYMVQPGAQPRSVSPTRLRSYYGPDGKVILY